MAGEGAELKLRVSLDLTSLRRQLSTIGTQLGGQALNLNIQFDRKSINSQLNSLQRQLGNKTFRVEVNTNLESEIKNADRLVKALRRVQSAAGGARGASPIGTAQLGRTAGQGGFSAAQIKSLFSAAIRGGLLDERELGRTRAQMVAALGSIGRDSIAGLLNGLSSGDAQLRAAAESLGDSLIAALKTALGIASPSKETGKLGKFAAEGFEKGFIAGMIKAERTIARAVSNAAIAGIYEGLTTIGNLAPAFVPLERALAAQIRQSFQRAMRDGMRASMVPGVQGGLLGLLGGGATGAAIGGARALGGAATSGLASLGAGGVLGASRQLGRLAIGDTSGLTSFVQEATAQAMHQAFSTGTLGALIGAAAVGGVAGSSGFVRGAIGSLTKQIIEGIANRILAGVSSITSGDIGPAMGRLAQAIVNALVRDLESRVRSMNIAFPSMLPALPPAYRGLPQAGGNAFGALPPAYRGLPGGTLGGALPGTVFAEQKRLVGDILSPSLKEALRGAANAFVDAVRAELNAAVRQVNVRDLGTKMQAALAPARIAGLLPAGVGPTPVQARIEQAYARSAARGVSVMAEGAGGGMPPILPPGVGRGPSPYRGPQRPSMPMDGMMGPSSQLRETALAGTQLAQSLRGADAFLRQARVPLSGAMQELGGEFSNAVKQVLLFGTAYKALAFVTALPGQALSASTALQTFNNQLLAVAGGAEQADRSFAFVDGLAQRFNVPLASARQGFIKLYASMSPAGFEPQQINNLFEGISKAAATFGLSADKVDRVNYAFAQMASKGQIMSEELRGQLGDVLPGALGLFAEAAQMTIPEFSKAMEDGAFKGEAMAQVLDNVAILLNTKFAGAAEGASKTLQGQLNAMQNAMQKMYEAFEPLVNTLAANLFPMLSETIIDAASAVQALSATMSGNTGPANMLSGNATAIYTALMQLKEVGSSVFTIIQNLAPTFLTLGRAVLSTLEQVARFINTPIGQFLANVAIQTALVTSALQMMAKLGIAQAIAGIIQLITNTRGAIASLQALIVTSKAAQLAIIGLGAGVVLAALTTLVGKLNEVYARMLDIQKGARNAAQAIAAMSQTEATVAARRYQNQIAALKKFQTESKGMGGMVSASAAEINAMAAAGATPGVAFTAPLQDKQKGIYGAGFIDPQMAEASIQRLSQLQAAAKFQARPIETAAPGLQKIDLSAGAAKGGAGSSKAANEAKRLAEEIARQAAAASDALFAEQQRLLILQQTNPTAKAIAEYTSQELTIKRELNQALKEAKSEKEKESLLEVAKTKSAANVLELEDKINQARKSALEPIERLLKDQKEQRQVEADIEELLRTGMSPERAKQVAEVRKLIREQLASFDLLQDEAKQAIVAAEARGASADDMERLRKILQGIEEDRKKAEGQGPEAEAGVPETKPKTAADYIGEGMKEASDNLKELMNIGYQVVEAAKAIGNAFGESFKGMISGSMTAQQALASFFQSVGDYFVDMAARMIAEWLTMKAIGLVASLLGGALGGGGGIVSAASPTVGAIGQGAGIFTAANGGIAMGGFQAFANGGVVKGPTLGLVGEGRYNEAIVPLPDGRSIPVELGDGAGNQIISNITVNVSNGQAQSNANGSNSSELGRKLEGAVKQVIVGELRPGGLLAGRR